MYRRILIALDNSPADDAVLAHVPQLAKLCGANLVLLHVADGWAARNFERLSLVESEEMRQDRAYLARRSDELRAQGFEVEHHLALGEPAVKIIETAEAMGCDLIALTSHGHKWIGDLFLGTTISKVRHNTDVPLLIVRAGSGAR